MKNIVARALRNNKVQFIDLNLLTIGKYNNNKELISTRKVLVNKNGIVMRTDEEIKQGASKELIFGRGEKIFASKKVQRRIGHGRTWLPRRLY